MVRLPALLQPFVLSSFLDDVAKVGVVTLLARLGRIGRPEESGIDASDLGSDGRVFSELVFWRAARKSSTTISASKISLAGTLPS